MVGNRRLAGEVDRNDILSLVVVQAFNDQVQKGL
tara:strand:- start:615 stop:716 length:102 start_codon:yes stop_codon:yes gene_type:complete